MKKTITVKTVKPNISHEKEFSGILKSMIDLMGRLFVNQVLKELNQNTIDKFEDAQIGNYARIFLALFKKYSKNISKRFDNDRIKNIVATFLSKVNKTNQTVLYSRLSKVIGIDSKQLIFQEKLNPDTNALIDTTTEWIKQLRDEALASFSNNTLTAMNMGNSISEILENFNGLVEKRKNQAVFRVRTQVATFNSLLTKFRAQNLGITKAIWVTSHDERVRRCHIVRDGKEFDLNKGLYSSCDGKYLLPGTDYQCRCTYELIITHLD